MGSDTHSNICNFYPTSSSRDLEGSIRPIVARIHPQPTPHYLFGATWSFGAWSLLQRRLMRCASGSVKGDEARSRQLRRSFRALRKRRAVHPQFSGMKNKSRDQLAVLEAVALAPWCRSSICSQTMKFASHPRAFCSHSRMRPEEREWGWRNQRCWEKLPQV